jgi:hypothetical protein
MHTRLEPPISLIDLGLLLVIQNHENGNVHNKGQRYAQHRKYKRLKIGAEFTYKLDKPQHWALQSEEPPNTEENSAMKQCILRQISEHNKCLTDILSY